MRVLIAVDNTDNAGLVMVSVAPWLRQTDGQATVLTVLGASGIHATQKSAGADVITPHGRLLLGSVAEAVVRRSPISVLLTRDGIRERKPDDAVAR